MISVMIRRQELLSYTLASVLLLYLLCDSAMAGRDLSMTIYGGKVGCDTMLESLALTADYEDCCLLTLAVSKRFASFKRYIDWEVEGQVVKHFGDQHHMEFNALIAARWVLFPWDKYIDTTFAVGEGLSYATETPKLEASCYDETSRLLDYMMFELALCLPSVPQWSVVTRVHHRSGAWGLFNGVHGASNALCFGARYTF